MTHTPGPWLAIADPYEDGTPYFRFKAGDAYVAGKRMGFEFTGIMREADARLIAAAPELLAALKALIRRVDRFNATGLPIEEVEAARAAVAKAEAVQ